MVSFEDNPAMASFISSGDIPAPLLVSDISTPPRTVHLDESLFHRTSNGAITRAVVHPSQVRVDDVAVSL